MTEVCKETNRTTFLQIRKTDNIPLSVTCVLLKKSSDCYIIALKEVEQYLKSYKHNPLVLVPGLVFYGKTHVPQHTGIYFNII